VFALFFSSYLAISALNTRQVLRVNYAYEQLKRFLCCWGRKP